MGAKVDMSKYKLVPEEKEEPKKGEFFIGKNHSTREVIQEGIELLTKEGEEGSRTLVLKARGQAVSKAVAVAEVIKRRVAGIHQIVKVDGGIVKHAYELKEEPTEDTRITQEKFVTGLQVCLSLDELDKTAAGYQEPLPEDQVTDAKDFTETEAAPKRRRSAKKGGNRGSAGASTGRGSGRGNGAPRRGAGGRGRSGKSGRGGQASGRAR